MYAAVVYAVKPGETSHILMAKTKLAPTSVQTLPRLELCAAELLANLTQKVIAQLQGPPAEVHFWSDSKVVLDWLSGHPSRWPTFVANRVSKITALFPGVRWKHVKSADNAADCATRGLLPNQIKENSLWWHAPAWIIKDPTDWPVGYSTAKIQASLSTQETVNDNTVAGLLEQISDYKKIRRILAYCAHWRTRIQLDTETRDKLRKASCEIYKLVKNPTAKRPEVPVIDGAKWSASLLFLHRAIQHQHYLQELECLRAGKLLPRRSNMVKFSPVMDGEGVMRVGGRLEYAELPYSERHPAILPGKSPIVQQYVRQVHLNTMHGGPQLMLSALHRGLWITQAPRIVAKIARACVKCTRYSAKPGAQQMAPLPQSRVTPQRPFTVAGLDYAGPIQTLFSKGRGAKSIKSYIAIFICFVTKAIHIEVVSDLTTTAFLAAYSRFTARRGVCERLYSDNATTFKGAAKELNQLFDEKSDFVKDVKGKLMLQRTEWTFIPPRALHFGGLWKAAVKSFKSHFVRVVGASTFTFEEISTLAAKIEACLNSRPLSPLPTDPKTPAVLTPGHFLVGTLCLSPPEPFDKDERLSLSNRWRLIAQLRNSFWVRWRKEVLHHMQLRSKWIIPQPNFAVGDVVILKDELSPPATWPLGIVTKLYPGKDNLVRTVDVKTAESSFSRPIVKLIKLHRDDEINDAQQINGEVDATISEEN